MKMTKFFTKFLIFLIVIFSAELIFIGNAETPSQTDQAKAGQYDNASVKTEAHADGKDAVESEGAQGSTGIPGTTGYVAPTGYMAPTGLFGSTGSSGFSGSGGSSGFTGMTGITGFNYTPH